MREEETRRETARYTKADRKRERGAQERAREREEKLSLACCAAASSTRVCTSAMRCRVASCSSLIFSSRLDTSLGSGFDGSRLILIVALATSSIRAKAAAAPPSGSVVPTAAGCGATTGLGVGVGSWGYQGVTRESGESLRKHELRRVRARRGAGAARRFVHGEEAKRTTRSSTTHRLLLLVVLLLRLRVGRDRRGRLVDRRVVHGRAPDRRRQLVGGRGHVLGRRLAPGDLRCDSPLFIGYGG